MNSNRLPTAKARPMTRGLQRTAVRTASTRQLQDKSYWIGQLRVKMNEIQKEMEKIDKNNTVARQENESFILFEKRAEDLTREISEYQDSLAEENLILEKLSICATIDDIITEFEQRTIQNQRDQDTLENIFEDRRKREEEVRSLCLEIDKFEESQTARLSAELLPQEYETFTKTSNLVKSARVDLENLQMECNEVKILVDQLHEEVQSDETKSQAASLFSKLSELKAKRVTLEVELQRSEDPIKELNQISEQVKSGNLTTKSLETQITILEKRIENASNSLNDKEIDLNNLKSGNAAEIKKLLKKSNQVNKMLSDWTGKEHEENQEIKNLEPKCNKVLERVKRLKEGIKRLPELDDQNVLDLASDNGPNQNAQNLSNEITQILILEKKLSTQVETFEDKILKLKTDIATFTDVATTRAEAEEKRSHLNQEREVLMDQRKSFQTATDSKTKILQNIKNDMNKRQHYYEFVELEKQLKNLSESNLELSESLEQKMVDATPVRNKVLQLEQDHQSWLQDRLLSGVGIQVE